MKNKISYARKGNYQDILGLKGLEQSTPFKNELKGQDGTIKKES